MITSYNTRRPIPEQPDPKQRIVGGIVLFALMLLIYSLLKLLLGISASTTSNQFGLNMPSNINATVETTASTPNNLPGAANTENPRGRSLSTTLSKRLPANFVFLDIEGRPMQKETYQLPTTTGSAEDIYSKSQEGRNWYVQAASFRDEERAQKLIQQITDKNIVADVNIVKSNDGWYMVRLPPETDRSITEQQKRQLSTLLGVKGVIKKIE